MSAIEPIDVPNFVGCLELIGEPEILRRYAAGQFRNKSYLPLGEQWLARKAADWEARWIQALVRQLAEKGGLHSLGPVQRELVIAAIDEVMAGT